MSAENFDVIVIGAGQAGLSAAYYLKQQGVRFVVLDANARVGDSWRKRWDSLRLFTPTWCNGLAGMPFPSADPEYLPTKDEMGDYLEAYARHFDLPVRCGVMVERLSRRDGRYVVLAGGRELMADEVVVAAAGYQRPHMPALGSELSPDIVQLHSSEYKNPAQLREGGVLLVGAGNSGAEIGMDVVGTHETWLSGRDVGHIPFKIGTLSGKLAGRFVLGILFNYVFTMRTPWGRRMKQDFITAGGPWIRQRPENLDGAGVKRVGRTTGVQDGKPVVDGQVLDVTNVIWCTGFHPGFEWIDLPGFDHDAEPQHDAGISTDQPGLYFVGLKFQYAVSSSMIQGVSRDARRVVGAIMARRAAAAKVPALPRVQQAAAPMR